MADQYAIQDQNNFPALLGHSGTAGTAETVRILSNNGTLVTSSGNFTGGTIDEVTSIAGTVTVNDISGAVGTTVVEQVTGTTTTGSLADIAQIHDAGTVAALPDLPGGTVDLVTSVSEVANLAKGTISVVEGTVTVNDISGAVGTTVTEQVTGTVTTGSLADVAQIHDAGTVAALPDLPGGTVDLVTSVTDVGDVSNLTKGTVTRVEGGTIGLISSIGGTVTVNDISGAAGTTVVEMVTGTLTTGSLADVAEIHTAGTVSALPDLPGGTIDAVSSVSNMVKGTVTRVEGGTITQASVIGGAASAAAASGNPVPVAGTDSGGTVYIPLVDTDGNLQIDVVNSPTVSVNDIPGGTIDEVTSLGALPDLPGGTVDLVTAVTTVTSVSNVVKGTVTRVEGGTVGKVDDLGSVANVAVVHNAGTVAALPDLPGGTVDLVTSVTDVGSVADLAQVHNAGTIAALPDLPGGTVDAVSSVTNVASGTLAVVTDVTDVSNVTGGTIQVDHNPVEAVTSYGTLGTTAAAVRGTLVAAVGAGTDLMVSGCSMVVDSGTVDCAICFGTMAGPNGADVIVRGKFPAGGGIARDFTIPLEKTNGTLTYYMGGAGTVYFQVNYWDE